MNRSCSKLVPLSTLQSHHPSLRSLRGWQIHQEKIDPSYATSFPPCSALVVFDRTSIIPLHDVSRSIISAFTVPSSTLKAVAPESPMSVCTQPGISANACNHLSSSLIWIVNQAAAALDGPYAAFGNGSRELGEARQHLLLNMLRTGESIVNTHVKLLAVVPRGTNIGSRVDFCKNGRTA